jgi:hypothetical protein
VSGVSRDCGKVLKILEPGGPLFRRPRPRANPVSRWIRRRSVRVRGWVHDYRYGRDIKEALLAHYILQCPKGLAADEGCGADCPYCTESTYRCDRERGHEGDHKEYDDEDNLLHNWRNEDEVAS